MKIAMTPERIKELRILEAAMFACTGTVGPYAFRECLDEIESLQADLSQWRGQAETQVSSVLASLKPTPVGGWKLAEFLGQWVVAQESDNHIILKTGTMDERVGMACRLLAEEHNKTLRPAAMPCPEIQECSECQGTNAVRIPCPDNKPGCLVIHFKPCPQCTKAKA